MCGKPALPWEDSLGRFLCQRIGSQVEKPQCWELSRGAACPLGRVASARGQEKATRNCGFQTGVLVTPSQKSVSHSNQNTRTHRIKTLFKEQLLALLYEAFSPFKKKWDLLLLSSLLFLMPVTTCFILPATFGAGFSLKKR